MIWIATLCLLVIAAWLFFNGLNEKRWVEAHYHDETVASDEGLLPNFLSRTSSGLLGGDSKKLRDNLNTRFAGSVEKIQEKTSSYGARLRESNVAAETRKAASSMANFVRHTASSDESEANSKAGGDKFISRTAGNVASKSEELVRKTAGWAREKASAHGEGQIGTVVGKVASKSEELVHKTADWSRDKATAYREGQYGEIGGKAAKVGARINEATDKMLGLTKKTAHKPDSE